MPSYVIPKKNTAFIFYTSLTDTANRPDFKSTPTLASGDFKVSTDGGALANLATLPTVTPAAGVIIKVSLSAGEMNGDNITIACIDAAGAEWDNLVVNIQTAARQIDDLAFPTTTGRSIDVTAAGEVGLDLDNTVGTLNAAQIGAAALTAAKFAAGAIDANALATDAVNEIVDQVWNEVVSGHATIGTFGHLYQHAVTGVAEAGTLSTTQMTTDLTEATDDHYKGRIIVWITGVLAGQATDITAYLGSTGRVTYTTITEAPTAADEFIIF